MPAIRARATPPARPSRSPGWNGYLALPNTHDIGVVVIDDVAGHTPASFGALPLKGVLDKLASKRGQQNLTMTVVGYGVQSVKPVASSVRERRVGTTKVVHCS